MSPRLVAGLLAAPLLLALWGAAIFVPLPYVTYTPGITVDVLGDGSVIQVDGAEAYPHDGGLLMTTVYVTQPDGKINLLDAVGAWLDRSTAIVPRDVIYGPTETRDSNRRQSQVMMVSSQDSAVAAAMRALGHDFESSVEVLNVDPDMPAHGRLQVRDELVRVAGKSISTPQDVVDAVVGAAQVGTPIPFEVRRRGELLTVDVTPKQVQDESGEPVLRVGIVPGSGFSFPFDVRVNIDEAIGGSSAGMMFALAIYETLTEDSLTGGDLIAGSGTIDAEGNVGPIGGVQQKIVAAERDGAGLFLVSAENCDEAVGAPRDEIRLAMVRTFSDAVAAVRDWTADPDADLPGCEAA
ncbi:YlbL family protein [Nocardioides limicola]|uniref:YlbL family protein n=1 Tax=Nocardioides limicola TaxID=2803368 RepID=UPI00193B9AAD|nr:PDZ domain-containing protein [Nocardioides sp. DJM-14]